MSQIKKIQVLQSGGPVKYKFKVDNKDFEYDDDALDADFDSAFKSLVSNGYAKNNDRDKWNERYQQWKNQAKSGTYQIDMQNDSLGSMKYLGEASNADKGITQSGESAKSNMIGRVFGGVDDADKQMSLLNSALGVSIGRKAGIKFNADNDKIKQDEEKAKLDKTKSDSDFVNKWEELRDIGVALYGKQGDSAWRQKEYWSGKSGQTQLFAKGLDKGLSYLMDNKFDDKEIKESFKNKYGIDIDEARKEIQSVGYKPDGSFINSFNFDRTYNLRNKLQLLSGNSIYTNRKTYTDAIAAAKGDASATATDPVPATAPVKQTTPASYQFDKNKRLLYGNQAYTGVYVNDDSNDGEYAYQSKATGHYLEGKKVDKNVFEQFLQSKNDPNLIAKYQKDLSYHRGEFDKLLKNYANMGEIDSGSNFVFNDFKDRSSLRAKEVSNMFTGTKGPNFRLYSYTDKDVTSLGTAKMSHRIVLPDGRIRDGRIKRGMDGKYKFHFISTADNKGYNIDLGDLDENDSTQKENTYYTPVALRRKEGGIVKAQMGAILKQNTQANKNTFQSATAADLGESIKNDNYKLSTADKASLVGLSADLTGLGLSMTGVGSVAAGVTGAVGTTANLVSDITRDGIDMGDIGNAALGYGLDAVTLIPGLGLAGKTGKILGTLRKSQQVLNAGMMAAGAYNAAKSLSKINEPSKMTIDDWRNITMGVQGLISGKRNIDVALSTKNVKANTIKANGETIKLNDADLTNINKATTSEARIAAAKVIAARELKTKGINVKDSDINLDLKTTNVAGKIGFKAPVKDLNVQTKNAGIELKDPTNANRYVRRAIKNTANMNPNMIGADAINKNAKINDKGDIDVNSRFNFLGNHFQPTKGRTSIREAIDTKLSVEPIDADVKQWQRYSPVAEVRPKGFRTKNYRSNNMNESDATSVKATENSTISKENETPSIEVAESVSAPITPAVSLANKAQVGIKKVSDRLKNMFSRKSTETTPAQPVETVEAVKVSTPEPTAVDVPKTSTNSKPNRDTKKKIAKPNTSNKRKKSSPKKTDTLKSNKKIAKNAEGGILIPKYNNGNKLGANLYQSTGLVPFFNGKNSFTKSNVKQLKPLGKAKPNIRLGQLPMLETLGVRGEQGQMVSDDLQRDLVNTGTMNSFSLNIDNQLNGKPKTLTQSNEVGKEDIKIRSPFRLPQTESNTVSELARALFIRNNNKNVDINVRPALLDNPIEIGTSVTGDLYTKSVFDARANNLRSSSRPTTSDGTLELARQLSTNQQAEQLRTQGDAVNAEALARNKAMSQENQQRFAMGRAQTANQNMGNLVGAQESMRQLKNMKIASMNQPIDDFWKAQNYKSMYEDQQNKGYDQQLKQLDVEEKLAPERQALVTEMDGLYTQIDMASKVGNSAKVQELTTKLGELKKKDNILSLGMKRWYLNSLKNPNLQIPQNFATFGANTTKVGAYANGGSIEKEILKEEGRNKREAIKQKNSISKELAKNYTKWLTDKSDDDSKEKIATMKQINDIIKSALS